MLCAGDQRQTAVSDLPGVIPCLVAPMFEQSTLVVCSEQLSYSGLLYQYVVIVLHYYQCYAVLNETIENRQKHSLIPSTSEHVKELFGWNWTQLFNLLDRTYCTLQLPQRGMSDLQITAEYVVYTLRYMFKQGKQEQQSMKNRFLNLLSQLYTITEAR
jgi:hypothetical protein